MAATNRFPIIAPSVLARAHAQHEGGMSWRDSARANGLGYTAMRAQLRSAGYDMTTRHPAGRGAYKAQPEKHWDASLASRMLSMPLRVSETNKQNGASYGNH